MGNIILLICEHYFFFFPFFRKKELKKSGDFIVACDGCLSHKLPYSSTAIPSCTQKLPHQIVSSS
jgi:hypothetical protein